MNVGRYFKDERLVKAINNALKLQTVVIGYTYVMSNLFPHDTLIKNTFKNLNTYIHENYMCIIFMFLQRMNSEMRKNNKFAKILKEILKNSDVKVNL